MPQPASIGLGISVASVGVTMMGGFATYPRIGIALIVVGIVIAVWPLMRRPTLVLETIAFDYMPGSPKGNPLNEGWTVVCGGDEPPPPKFDVIQDPTGAYGLEMTDAPGCAIQYIVSPAIAVATERVRLRIKYSAASMFWLLVQLSAKNGANTFTRQLQIRLEGGSRRQPEQHPEVIKERTVWVASKSLGQGWVALDLNVRKLVDLAWGKDGLALNVLHGVQLRGTVAVSPISMLARWK